MSMTVLFLIITQKVTKSKSNIFRILLASIISCVILVFCIYTELVINFSIIIFELTVVITTFIAFNPKGIKQFLRSVYFLNIITVLCGGVFYLMLSNSFFNNLTFYIRRINITYFVVTTIVVYGIIKFIALSNYKNEAYNENVAFFIDDKKIELNGLVDSGNSLQYCGKNVSFINPKSLGDKYLHIADLMKDNVNVYEMIHKNAELSLLAIEYKTVSDKATTVGISIDKMMLGDKQANNCILAFTLNIDVGFIILNSKVRDDFEEN